MELRDNQKRAEITLWGFYILFVLACLTTFSEILISNVSESLLYIKVHQVITSIYSFTFLVAVILFLRWFHRAYYNLHQTKPDPSYGQGWSVGGWFLPIASFFVPYFIMREIWRHTQEKANALQTESPMLLISWWLLFNSRFLSIFAIYYLIYSNSINDLQPFESYYFSFLSILMNAISLASLAALLLIIKIVKKISHWETIIYNNDASIAIEDHLLDFD